MYSSEYHQTVTISLSVTTKVTYCSLITNWHLGLSHIFAHGCTIWRSFVFVKVMTAPLQWRALFEILLPGLYLWRADSYESPFVLSLARNMMEKNVSVCGASFVQRRPSALLFLPHAGWPERTASLR